MSDGDQLVDLPRFEQSLAPVNSGDEVLGDIANNCVISDIIRDVSFIFLTNTVQDDVCVVFCYTQGFLSVFAIAVSVCYTLCSICFYYLAIISYSKKFDYILENKLEARFHGIPILLRLSHFRQQMHSMRREVNALLIIPITRCIALDTKREQRRI